MACVQTLAHHAGSKEDTKQARAVDPKKQSEARPNERAKRRGTYKEEEKYDSEVGKATK